MKNTFLVSVLAFLWLNVLLVSAEEPNGIKHLTLLATNDMHGAIEPSKDSNGRMKGGMALWAGIVDAIRSGTSKKYKENGGVLVLDAGDQYQGTLLSNYNEGELMFRTMNEVRYDAAVVGNHGFDFGPKGWLEDTATKEHPEKSREVLEGLAKISRFKLLGANVLRMDTIVDSLGQKIMVRNAGCDPTKASKAKDIDWDKAQRPDFLQAYKIFEIAGVRIAVIGLEHWQTATNTMFDNVADLCFAHEYETYMRTYEYIKKHEKDVPIFILLLHAGDVPIHGNQERSASDLVRKLTSDGKHVVDAVISAHTHWIYNENINGVPLIQSGSSLEHFGRLDIDWDSNKKQLVRINALAGLGLWEDRCDEKASDFCQIKKEGERNLLFYEQVPVVKSSRIGELVNKTKDDPEFEKRRTLKVAVAQKDLVRHAIKENALADALSDSLLKVARDRTQAPDIEIAIINSSGLRENIKQGEVNYENFFKVIPFNNHLSVLGPLTMEEFLNLEILKKSIRKCTHGALMQSGLKVTFESNCSGPASHEEDGEAKDAKFKRIELVSKSLVVYDAEKGGIQPEAANITFRLVTVDFLAKGGSGYSDFKKIPSSADLGVLRELLTAEDYLKTHGIWNWTGQTDGRWTNTALVANTPPTGTHD
ncbi:MAG: bifunctional metallophosphatase/5'-nucleotidase [Deltaproteobacteria bacterium]|nr:bifunctional metallophosphatase/5'-nucleotidase [Deltaproteobacteria bacterium]